MAARQHTPSWQVPVSVVVGEQQRDPCWGGGWHPRHADHSASQLLAIAIVGRSWSIFALEIGS